MNERVGQDPAAEDPFRAGFDEAAIGLAVLSADGAGIVAANRALHDLVGWPPGTLSGRAAAELLNEGPDGLRDGLQVWRRADGAPLDVRVRRAGRTLVVEAVDVDAAAHSEANREALAAAGLGEWRWDRATGLLTLSRRAARILGRPPGRSVSWEELKTGLSQAELARLRALIAEADGTDEPYQFDTATTVAGRTVILRVRGQAVPGPDGTPAGMVGILQDITTRVEARDEILSRDQRLRVATTVARLGIFAPIPRRALSRPGLRADRRPGALGTPHPGHSRRQGWHRTSRGAPARQPPRRPPDRPRRQRGGRWQRWRCRPAAA